MKYNVKKLMKLLTSPGYFFRDYFNKKYPVFRNESGCLEDEENILIKHDIALEEVVPTHLPVDIVYTWVDSKDSTWRRKFEKCSGEEQSESGLASRDGARFSNHNEIYYSLKSVLKYLPWVRHIYIITDGQDPGVLHLSNKIKLIDHKDIIEEKYLPTFNSHVIEAHLHRIDSLSEYFIYFNDDVFVARPLPAAHFFRSNGLSSLFLSDKSLSKMRKRGVKTPTLNASLHSAALLQKDFSVAIDTPLVHTYVPLKKSMFESAWFQYRKEIENYLNNKFRKDNDLNMATFLVPWFSYLNGSSVQTRDICHYFNIRSRSAPGYYNYLVRCRINNKMPHSICANDFNSVTKSIDNYNDILNANMKYHFDNESLEKITPHQLS